MTRLTRIALALCGGLHTRLWHQLTIKLLEFVRNDVFASTGLVEVGPVSPAPRLPVSPARIPQTASCRPRRRAIPIVFQAQRKAAAQCSTRSNNRWRGGVGGLRMSPANVQGWLSTYPPPTAAVRLASHLNMVLVGTRSIPHPLVLPFTRWYPLRDRTRALQC